MFWIPVDGAGIRRFSADVDYSQLGDAWKVVVVDGAGAVTSRLSRGNTSEFAHGIAVGRQVI